MESTGKLLFLGALIATGITKWVRKRALKKNQERAFRLEAEMYKRATHGIQPTAEDHEELAKLYKKGWKILCRIEPRLGMSERALKIQRIVWYVCLIGLALGFLYMFFIEQY